MTASLSLLACAVAAACMVVAVPAAPTTFSQAAEESSALQDFGACVGESRRGDLLLLVDESGSLRESDPGGARVSSATYLAEELAEAGELNGFTIDVSVATFSSNFSQVLGWTPLDSGLAGVTSSIAELSEADRGRETDYWNALEGARRVLADKAALGEEGQACQALAWFSDGQLDLEARDSPALRDSLGTAKLYAPGVDLSTEEGAAAAEAAAAESLCRDGGLADQLRAAGVTTFGLGLAVSDDDPFALMRSVAEGRECGGLTQPSPGEFVLARDVDDLLFAFDRFSSPGQPPLVRDALVCQGEVCAEQAHTFVLDDSIRSVRILGGTDVDGVRALLTSPTGLALELPRDGSVPSGSAPGSELTSGWESGRTVSVDLARAGDGQGWAGVWSLVFVDSTSASPQGRSRSNIRIVGDIRPAVTLPDAPLVAGEVSPVLPLSLEDSDGAGIDPAGLLGSMSLSVDLVRRDGSTARVSPALKAGDLVAGVAVDLSDTQPGPAALRLSLSVTTAEAVLADGSVVPGTQLEPTVVDVPLSIRPPLDFPTVTTEVAFGTTDRPARLSGELTVSGPGCVWVPDQAPELRAFPLEIGETRVSSQAATAQDCLEVAADESLPLGLELTTEAAGSGALDGTIVVQLAPEGDLSRATEVEVAIAADLRRPLDTPAFVGWALLALVLGPGLPLLLLYLLKWYGARIPARGLAISVVPVVVDGASLRRDDALFDVQDHDLVSLVPVSSRGARRADTSGVELRTRVGWSPFGPAVVSARLPGSTGASEARARPRRDGSAQLPLAVHNTWAVFRDTTTGSGRVVLLLAADASADSRRRVAEHVRQRGAELLAQLSDAGGATGGDGSTQRDPLSGGPVVAPPDSAPGENPFDAATQPGPTSSRPDRPASPGQPDSADVGGVGRRPRSRSAPADPYDFS